MVWNRAVHMYKNGFALNDLRWLICPETKPNQTKYQIELFVLYSNT